jgi:RimJ/RimL family protein N-acetyltransferase
VAAAADHHLASRRVLEKAGMTLVRIFHQPWPYQVDGRELGDAEYAVSKAEWDQQNGIKLTIRRR